MQCLPPGKPQHSRGLIIIFDDDDNSKKCESSSILFFFDDLSLVKIVQFFFFKLAVSFFTFNMVLPSLGLPLPYHYQPKINYELTSNRSAGKESSCNAGDLGFDSWVGKIPWRKERLPTPVFWPGEFHGLYS